MLDHKDVHSCAGMLALHLDQQYVMFKAFHSAASQLVYATQHTLRSDLYFCAN